MDPPPPTNVEFAAEKIKDDKEAVHSMDPPPPPTNVEFAAEKIKDEKEAKRPFHCDLYDTEVVYKIAQALVPGLATACVDNTTGDIFRSPGSMAADIRKDMVIYLTQRSETFVAEHVVLDGGPEAEASDQPYDIITDFIDDFATSKRNLFSRVSSWLLSERREDNIDDFAQEMEVNGFWLMDRREALAQTLLKNVDFKNEFHCAMSFNSEEELAEHKENCGYRSMLCENEGCDASFCASHMEEHNSVCPFMIIPCEQKCSESIMRREMDRHCITLCPMKLVSCPFYGVGCQATVPQCKLREHYLDDLHSHLMCILRNIHKGASVDDLNERITQIQQLSNRVAEARDARALTHMVKDLDAKLGPLEVKVKDKVNEDGKKTTDEEGKETMDGEGKQTVDKEGIEATGQDGTKTLDVEGKDNAKEEGKGAMNSKADAPEKADKEAPEIKVANEVDVKGTEGRNSTAFGEAERKLPEVEATDKVNEGDPMTNSPDEAVTKPPEVEVMTDRVIEEGPTANSTTRKPDEAATRAPEVEVKTDDVNEEGSMAQKPDEVLTRAPEVEVMTDKVNEEAAGKSSTAQPSEEAEPRAPELKVTNKVDEEGMERNKSAAHASGEAETEAQNS